MPETLDWADLKALAIIGKRNVAVLTHIERAQMDDIATALRATDADLSVIGGIVTSLLNECDLIISGEIEKSQPEKGRYYGTNRPMNMGDAKKIARRMRAKLMQIYCHFEDRPRC